MSVASIDANGFALVALHPFGVSVPLMVALVLL